MFGLKKEKWMSVQSVDSIKRKDISADGRELRTENVYILKKNPVECERWKQ